MNARIDRVHFEERQYLRSYDWTTEQLYHMEMRRRLNLALHLWGIVQDLDVREVAGVPGMPKEFAITRGMAIDAFGREIVVGQDYVLTGDDLRRNQVQYEGRYWLSIAYRRELTTPPAPGYRLCDQKDQYTRWRESFEILITPNDPTPAGGPPAAADTLSDDPAARPWPVTLGRVDVDATLTITNAWAEQRTYIGVRAQRIVAPVASLSNAKGESKLPIKVDADLRARRNLEIGDGFLSATGFAINPGQVTPTPTVSPFPRESGTLKVGSDIFLGGNLYASVAGQWLGLRAYVQSLVPEIKPGTVTITPAPTSADPSNGTEIFTLTSTLPVVQSASMMVALAGFDRISWNDYLTWLGQVMPGNPVQLKVGAGTPTKKAGTDNVFDFSISWTIGPKSNPPAPNPPMLHIASLTVSYIAIFFP
jgi:hypothetical protein